MLYETLGGGRNNSPSAVGGEGGRHRCGEVECGRSDEGVKTGRGDGVNRMGRRGEGVVSMVFVDGVFKRREERGISSSRMFTLDRLCG